MERQVRTLAVGLFISVAVNIYFIAQWYNHKDVVPVEIDDSKWTKKVDSINALVLKRDGVIDSLKVAIEAKAVAVKSNQTKVNNDVVAINKYTDMYRLYDSLYTAR
jgi:alpha-L-arabinofuranosidase